MTKKKIIIVIGSVNADTIVYLDRLPARHETILAEKSVWAVGGKGGNQAVAASRAGGTVKMLANIGIDFHGDACLKHLTENGVDKTHIHRSIDVPTGQAIVLVDKAGDNMIAVAAGANALLNGDLVKAYFGGVTSAATVLFQLETPIDTVRDGLVGARQVGATTILNPAPYHESALSLLPHCDVITPNQAEASGLTKAEVNDAASAEIASEKLVSLGANSVVITLGKEGCFVRGPEGAAHIPAFDTGPAVDSTGAGDVFNGVLAVGLAEGASLIEAARLATAGSGLSVKVETASDSAPTRAQIDALLA